MDINLTLQSDILRTIKLFTEFGLELDLLSKYISPQMYCIVKETWSEAITASFSQTIRDHYGDSF